MTKETLKEVLKKILADEKKTEAIDILYELINELQ